MEEYTLAYIYPLYPDILIFIQVSCMLSVWNRFKVNKPERY